MIQQIIICKDPVSNRRMEVPTAQEYEKFAVRCKAYDAERVDTADEEALKQFEQQILKSVRSKEKQWWLN